MSKSPKEVIREKWARASTRETARVLVFVSLYEMTQERWASTIRRGAPRVLVVVFLHDLIVCERSREDCCFVDEGFYRHH